VCGMAGIGKSTLVRGAIELRRAETPAVWIGCENLDVDHLLAEIGAGMGLGTERLLRDVSSRLATRIASVLGAVTTPGIVILDGFEDLLDEKGNLNSSDIADAMDAFATLEHKLKVLVTTRQLPNGIGAGSAGIRILHLGGLSKPMSQELLRSRMHQDAQQSPLAIPPELLEKLGATTYVSGSAARKTSPCGMMIERWIWNSPKLVMRPPANTSSLNLKPVTFRSQL